MKEDTKIYSALVVVASDFIRRDVIAYDGAFWLVLRWLQDPRTAVAQPARVIPLGLVRHTQTIGDPHADFVVDAELPKELFDDPFPGAPIAAQFGLVEMPPVFRTARMSN